MSLRPSSTYRWAACPGSERLAADLPDLPTTFYAMEGTVAHALAARALEFHAEPHKWIGDEMEVRMIGDEMEVCIDGGELVAKVMVTQDMADAVQVYTDYVRQLGYGHAEWPFGIEQRVPLDALNPPAALRPGTADFWIYPAPILHVVDLKFGSGVFVKVENNPQLLTYALGAFLQLPIIEQREVEEIWITIVQPRLLDENGFAVRTWKIGFGDLVEFKRFLWEAALATQQPDAPLVAGEHCRFCPARGICPALRGDMESKAMVEFSSFVTPQDLSVEHLTDSEIGTILRASPQIRAWLEAVRDAARARLDRGEPVSGYKLVAGRSSRQWKDEKQAREYLEQYGIEPEKRALLSPAQAEEALKEIKETLPTELVKIKRGVSMVQDDDSRPALTSGAEDFAGLLSSAAQGNDSDDTEENDNE